jgi:hypothetical protein
MSTQIGDRVGAILGKENDKLVFLGYGVYDGEYIPEEGVNFIAKMLTKNKIPNPRIRLDNGGVVYGCECWWQSEAEVKRQLSGREDVILVKIDDVRNKYREEENKKNEEILKKNS